MSIQLTHDEYRFESKTFPLIVICDHIYFQQNIGSLFRTCEAFGVEKIYFFGENVQLTPRKINKTSRSTHLQVPHEIIEDKNQLLNLLEKGNFEIVALEITNNSTNIIDLK